MNIQNIIVAFVVLAALFYIAAVAFKKLKSFSLKSAACASDCGCGDSKSKAENRFVKIQKT